MKFILLLLVAIPGAILTSPARADDAVPVTLRADREAIERIYHAHRLGVQETFEKTMPAADLDQLVRLERKKESILRRVYHIEINPAMLAAEVERIHTTTRAPEVLAEIKQALGGDPSRFADAVVRPLIVERELRRCFDSDSTLHAPKLTQAEEARAKLLAGHEVAKLTETIWQRTPRPASYSAATVTAPPLPAPANAKSKTYTNHATVQRAQSLTSSAPAAANHEKQYLEDLAPGVQNIITSQLQEPGDVTTVIDLSGGFTIFHLMEKAPASLTTGSLTILKRSYADWTAQQP